MVGGGWRVDCHHHRTIDRDTSGPRRRKKRRKMVEVGELSWVSLSVALFLW